MSGVYFVLVVFIIITNLNTQSNASHIFEKLKYKTLDAQGLYASDDKVEILYKNNFKSKIYGQEHAWIVEFYNSWCGFCKRFAPVWKEFAADVHDWRRIVSVGAIDCSDDANNDVCREFEILGYPTLRYFHENYVQGPKNLGEVLKKGQNATEIREFAVEKLIQEQLKGNGASWPSIVPHQFEKLSDAWLDVPSNIKVVLLIFDHENATLPAEVILDLNALFGVSIKYVSNSQSLAKTLQVERLPSLVSVERDLTFTILTPKNTSRENLRRAILMFLQSKRIINTGQIDVTKSAVQGTNVHNQSANLPVKSATSSGDVYYQGDLETGLRYILSHEIIKLKTVSGDSLQALRDFLSVLAKYFPFSANGRALIINLRDKVNDEKDEWTGKELEEAIDKLEEEHSPVYSTLEGWIGCKGSAPHLRGFTCSLWNIFHVMTVNAANSHSSNPQEVLQAMLGYVKYFFGCSDCSRHFQLMAERNKLNSVAEHDGAILWLWVGHNEVNHRLAGDSTEDPQYPKKQYPTSDNCPKCRHPGGGWDLTEVLHYLKTVYNVSQINLTGAVPHPPSSSPLSTLDMALFSALCLCSAIMIFLALRFLLTSRKFYRKKTYIHDTCGKV